MTDQPRNPRQIAGPIAFALLILLGLLAIHSIEPPAAADANAPLAEFSAARAMRDVREIAKAPRMLGSAENDRVRDYLVGRLRELGASPEVQTATVARHTQSGPDTWAIVNNVVATIPGTSPTGSVLMVAHYDSAPSGPGAADNAASVAAILEAMRALKTGPAARNDLIVLFTDGEELGLLGAKAFVETQPALSNIKVVLNFEMRGDDGPSVMFQSRSQHSWLAARRPIPPSSSLAESLAWGETDLNVFLAAGIDGMSFGATRGIAGYHTELDNADLLDHRSLQSQGALALSTAREFGAIDLNDLRSESAASIVRDDSLSRYMATMLAFLVPVLLLGVIWIGIRNGQFTIAGLAAGFAIYVVAIAVSIVASIVMWHLTAMLAGWRMLPIGTTYGGFYFAIAADALIFGALWAAYMVIGRSISEQNLGVGCARRFDSHVSHREHRDPKRRASLLVASVRDARNQHEPRRNRRATDDSRCDSRVHCSRVRHNHVRAIVGLQRGRNDASPRVRWIGQRLALRSVHPLHGPAYRRSAMDRARRARIARDRDDHQRQRGQLIRRVSAAS